MQFPNYTLCTICNATQIAQETMTKEVNTMKCMSKTKSGNRCSKGGSEVVELNGKRYRSCKQHKEHFDPATEGEEIVTLAQITTPTEDVSIDVRTHEEAAQQKLSVTQEVKMTKIMVTGHREVNVDEVEAAMDFLMKGFKREYGDVLAIAGGNMGNRGDDKGADRLWARVALANNVPFDIYVPRGYGENYYSNSPKTLARFNRMLEAAREVHWTQREGTKFHFTMNFKRNVDMVMAANVYVVVSVVHPNDLRKRDRGGTRHAVQTMFERGVTDVWWIHSQTGNIELAHLS